MTELKELKDAEAKRWSKREPIPHLVQLQPVN